MIVLGGLAIREITTSRCPHQPSNKCNIPGYLSGLMLFGMNGRQSVGETFEEASRDLIFVQLVRYKSQIMDSSSQSEERSRDVGGRA